MKSERSENWDQQGIVLKAETPMESRDLTEIHEKLRGLMPGQTIFKDVKPGVSNLAELHIFETNKS